MNRALYYSLMESRHLMRDTILVEAYTRNKKGEVEWKHRDHKAGEVDVAPINPANLNPGVKDPNTRTSKAFAGMTNEQIRAAVNSPKNVAKRAEMKEWLKSQVKRGDAGAPLTPEQLAKNAKKTAYYKKKPGFFDVMHPRHTVGKFAHKTMAAVGDARKDLGAEYEHIRRGGLKAALKTGVKIGAPLLAGMAIGARRIGKEVQSMPAYQHAKQYGDTIEKVKKYGPYAAAAGVGYLGLKALSND